MDIRSAAAYVASAYSNRDTSKDTQDDKATSKDLYLPYSERDIQEQTALLL